MARRSPFHERTSAHCSSLRWKDWSGIHAVCAYEDSLEREYHALRHAAGVLDVSPLFKLDISGPDAVRLLSRVTVRDVAKLGLFRVQYTCWCDDDGKVVDDGTLTRLGEQLYRLTAAEPPFAWVVRHARGLDVQIEDRTDQLAALAVQGPHSRELLVGVCDADLVQLRYFHAEDAKFRGGFDGLVTRTGYTGELGYEVWVEADRALALWDDLFHDARALGVRPVGLDALDLVRLEAGFLLLGVDYRSSLSVTAAQQRSTPDELGLGWMVALEREPFIGQSAIRAERAVGRAHAVVGLELDVVALERLHDDAGVPFALHSGTSRESVPVYSGGRQVGHATSRAWSPTLKRYIGLATVEAQYAALGTRLSVEATVEHARRTIPAKVTPTPFYDPARRKA